MYACHYYCQATYKAIAKYFGLKQAGSVCYPLAKVKEEIREGEWNSLIEEIEERYFIIQ
jgi:16S rRNA C1402 (ribose-2'-O) methylase RsmI